MTTDFDPDAPAAQENGIFGLPHGPEEARAHVISVPFDATTSYRKGARHGPAAVLAASLQVDLFDRQTGEPWRQGIAALPPDSRIAAWNEEASALTTPIIAAGGAPADDPGLARVNAIGAELNALVRAATTSCLDAGRLPCILGGDHSVPFGAIDAAAARHPGLGILHFDAHADLRPAYEDFEWSHASIFHNVLERVPQVGRLVQVGIRDLGGQEARRIESDARITTLFDDEWAQRKLHGADLRTLVRETLRALPDTVWISFDIDGLEPALCPNTGTPVPGGLDWHETMLWLSELARTNKRIVGLDLCEVSPGNLPDDEGEGWDAVVGARLLYRLIGTALAGTT